MRAERGNADFDVRHSWTSSGTASLPFGEGTAWGGWSVNAISAWRSGRPFTVLLPGYYGERPNTNPLVDWKHPDQGPTHWINSDAFSPPALCALGNLGRNTLRGPQLFNIDFSVVKRQRLADRADLQIRAEFFNVLNHPVFGLPDSVLGSTLGVVSSIALPERQSQFGVKLGF